jgi:hypothetical protein
MKPLIKLSINPIHRDLAIVLLTSLLVAVLMVSMAIFIFG